MRSPTTGSGPEGPGPAAPRGAPLWITAARSTCPTARVPMAVVLCLCALSALGCTAASERVPAIVDADRPTSFWDVPFPSDTTRLDGAPDLRLYPRQLESIVGRIAAGWVDRIPTATRDFSNNSPIWFRFEGPIAVPASTDGRPDDPVVLVDAATGDLIPLDLRFVEDPGDDPFLAPMLLVAQPRLGFTPRSGATLIAAVTSAAGAEAAAAWTLSSADAEVLRNAGVVNEIAVATRYTVQDTLGELRAHAAALDAFYAAQPRWADVELRRVLSLRYEPGETPSGRPALVATQRFEDGSSSTHFQAFAEQEPFEVDLGAPWPMAVYQAEIPVPYFQGLADRPFMRPGAMHVADDDEYDGWLRFDDGTLLNEAEVDTMRIVLSVPKGPDGAPIDGARLLIWDHGTGGSAWNHVHRRAEADRGEDINAAAAALGVAILGRDQPLYGTRFPLIDEGFSDGSLGFYNIVNLPAFRDNQRQGAIEGLAALRFAEEGLNDALDVGSIDAASVLRGGHSLGSVTAHGGIAASPELWDAAFVSGAGAWFVLNILESGLAGTGSALFETLADLLGVQVEPGMELGAVLAAGLGIEDPEAVARVDRSHPAMAPFQWIVDPADPSTFVEALTPEMWMLTGIGDWQVPNIGSDALWSAYPAGHELTRCEPLGDYDPHHCLFREDQGIDAITRFLDR